MLVEVIQMRATGMKLTEEELAAAPRHLGYLTVWEGIAYLHSEPVNYTHGHVLTPLYQPEIPPTLLRGQFVVRGMQPDMWVRPSEKRRQAWWVHVLPQPPAT